MEGEGQAKDEDGRQPSTKDRHSRRDKKKVKMMSRERLACAVSFM
jgi:hypothetical protein